MYFDPTYFLVLIGVVLSLLASGKVKSTFSRYSQVRNSRGLTGAQAAEQVLHTAGIYDVRISISAGILLITMTREPRCSVYLIPCMGRHQLQQSVLRHTSADMQFSMQEGMRR